MEMARCSRVCQGCDDVNGSNGSFHRYYVVDSGRKRWLLEIRRRL
jgi:hypothetical protein